MLRELNKQALRNVDWSMKTIKLLKYQKDRKFNKRFAWNAYPNIIEKTEKKNQQNIN